ncbi:MAG TPA: hypothetical protein GX523_15340 [Desulfitobacterium dehalogenans]|uniref:Phage protein, HK97 gp10 family n=1 Tax=Desulfitobacterium dehalogenans TaxID=36854 RepID=A0A7C6Z617_9FIRM|nr:hypothetical protein [Desulfitobacterium dehalogenans]
MARMTFKAGDEYALKLSRLATNQSEIAKKAIYAGAKIVADEIKSNLDAIPEEKFRYLRDGDQFSGITQEQKRDLLDSFGITPITTDEKGNWNAKIGFDGYGSKSTKKYHRGLPNQLLARAIESGSSVRRKVPFVRPAVTAKKKAAQAEMGRVVDEEIKKLMK